MQAVWPKIGQFLEKVAKISALKLSLKAEKHLHQTTFETFNQLQQTMLGKSTIRWKDA